MLGSRVVRSGNILSGQVGQYHLASGVGGTSLVSGSTSTRAQFLAPFVSGSAWTASTQEVVSGVRAAALSLSGNVLVAMAGVSGRMPAIGLVVDNAASGAPVNLYTAGVFQLTSGLADYSGYLGQQLFVGRSGQVVTISGSFNSGGLLSGDALQPLGYATSSGGLVLSVAAGLPLVPSLIYSGNIGSGSVGWPHLASGLLSGIVQSGSVGSGSVIGRSGGGWTVASGSLSQFDIAAGGVGSGNIASGSISSGMLASGFIANLGGTSLTSGIVQSGHIASGAVQGFFGVTRQIASGTVGVWDLGSGAVTAGALGSGAVQSGNIASGQIGFFHLQSGLQLSGLILSGGIGSGAVMGQPGGGYFNIASGTIGANELASGSVLSGTLASGQVGSRHISSGATIEFAHKVLPFHGGFPWTIFTQENISGARAVSISPSGRLQVAMASVSGRMPAIGFVIDSQLSGASTNVYALGDFQLASGMGDFSGYVGQPLYVGRSGQIVTASGSWNSGGLQSGDFVQYLGVPVNSGAVSVQIQTGPFLGGGVNTVLLPGVAGPVLIASGGGTASSLLSGIVQSGHLASGAVQGFFGTVPNIASGTVGVFDFGSGAVVAGTMGSGAVQSGNIASGQVGQFTLASGSVTSGSIASGVVHQFSIALNSVKSGLISSGCIGSNHLTSGLTATRALFAGPYFSGTSWTALTGETVSGLRAVSYSPSGFLQIAMASVSGRGPAIGVVPDNVASGIQANVYTLGVLQSPASGVLDFSGYLGQPLYVGRSGQLVTASGAFNSGGLLSGDLVQVAGVAVNSGAASLSVQPPPYQMGGTNVVVLPGVAGPVLFASGGGTAAGLPSGIVQSGHLASGSVQGFFGATPNVASGTLGVWDLGSGAVIAGAMGSGAVRSGSLASGVVGSYHLASGAAVTTALTGAQVLSGLSPLAMLTGETVSGVRAVAVSASGRLQVAMAGIATRMPAVGIIFDNVLSGIQANVFHFGMFAPASGLIPHSGNLGELLYVGRSGQVVTASGWFNSGGLLSGDVTQPVGFLHNSGVMGASVNALPPFVPSLVYSGMLGSGQISQFALASGAVNSGQVGSGAVLGSLGGGAFTIASGTVGPNDLASGAVRSGALASGQVGLFHLQSGLVLSGLIKSGGIGSGAVMGQPGAGAFNIASGTIGIFELASGAVLSGHVASGQLGTMHLSSGTIVTNANYALFNVSGLKTGEAISGVRAVNMSLSGFFQIAMTNISGRMPVVGVITVNLASGDPVSGAACFTQGTFQLGSGISYFPVLGTSVFAGRSGHLVTFSGSWNSGGFVSGDIAQSLGVTYNSGGLWLNVAESWPGGFALSGPSRLGFF